MESRTAVNPFLSGGFKPIGMECEYSHVLVEGAIPRQLSGTFYRIGPNPQFTPRGSYNPLNGDGMVHAFRLGDGRVSYRNRWVRTQQWAMDRAAGRALFGTSGMPADSDASVARLRTDGVANTNIVWHGGRLLALEEGHGPIEIDPMSLETVGRWSFNDRLPRNMTAHPKLDPESGEMIFFANFPTGKLTGDIELYFADADGILTRSRMIAGPFPALVHDFAVTDDFIIVAFCPVTVSIQRAMAGGPAIAWEPELGTHVAIIGRKSDQDEVRWFTGDACMAWHSMNAFNQGDRVVVDLCQQEAAMFPRADGSPIDPRRATQLLTRWEFDWSTPGSFSVEMLSDERCEYPRIDDRYLGKDYRYGFLACIGGPGSDDIFHRGIARFDHRRRQMEVYAAGPRCAVAEPVFVARSADAKEGEGYLLTNIYDEDRNTSHLAIFDAEEIGRGPIARAHLDHRVPVGFHGNWRPDATPA
ncbi:MAG TPA: carotenoid oxygenase family protein [Candidatus Binataceae bacterium]|nr:carotenoid oxygenase family protein [Candidatus Binataceae bacterium]